MRSIIVLLLLCGVSSAQSQEPYVDSLEAAIKQGAIAAFHDNINVGILSGNPAWARRICSAAVECKLDAALQEREDLKDAAERIRQIGARSAENNDESADAWSAAADGAYFRLRVQLACGDETATEDWLHVADALEKQHGLQPADGAPLERAAKCLREGQRAKGIDAAQLKKREDEVCKEGAKLYPDNGLFARNEQSAELEEIVALLAAKGEKEAKPRLAALLGAAKDDTLYNDAVTVAKQHWRKLGIKAEYRSTTRKFFDHLEFEVPTGDRWEAERDKITQYGRDGKLLRTFSLDWFKRNTLYTLGDTEYDGENPKGMALITERDVLSVIVKVERRSKIIKKNLNRNIPGVQYFEIGGHDKDAEFTRFHSFVWRSQQRTWLTYRLWILELKDYDGLDPEAQSVVDSLRETRYVGKDK